MFSRYKIYLIFSVVGIVVGYLVIHPYSMLLDALMHEQQSGDFHLSWEALGSGALSSFYPMMLPMAISFSFLGGIIGFLTALIVDRKKKLYDAQNENEKNKIALETVNNLMVTMSHYLLNSNTIIGGAVRQCRRLESKQDMLTPFSIIEEQGRKIDTAVKALGKITEIKTADYASDGQIQMIDIAQELETELKKKSDE